MEELYNFISEMENLYDSAYFYLHNSEFNSFRERVLNRYKIILSAPKSLNSYLVASTFLDNWKKEFETFKLFNVAEIKEKLI